MPPPHATPICGCSPKLSWTKWRSRILLLAKHSARESPPASPAQAVQQEELSLRQFVLLADLNPADLKQIAPLLRPNALPGRRNYLYRTSTPADTLYLVEKGAVRVQLLNGGAYLVGPAETARSKRAAGSPTRPAAADLIQAPRRRGRPVDAGQSQDLDSVDGPLSSNCHQAWHAVLLSAARWPKCRTGRRLEAPDNLHTRSRVGTCSAAPSSCSTARG
jgi:hypothetical protein